MNTIIIPLGKESRNLFRYKISADILNFLARNRYKSFSISEIAKKINRKKNDLLLRKAIKELEKNRLVKIKKEKKAYEISINLDLIYDPKDKFAIIPQDKYRMVLKEIVNKVKKQAEAMLLFGSVAEGRADRMSDIDLFVVSDSAKITKITEKTKFYFENKRAERYKLNIYVETTKNFEKMAKNREPIVLKVIKEGIGLFSTKKFEKVLEKLAI